MLSGSASVRLLWILCLLKFLSWAVALGSGTSGGTLAPLLTIGGATGALAGHLMVLLFPGLSVSISVCALVGMAAMFAGASRALLTSILFALETTGQLNGLLPLIAGSTASYFVSFFLMDTTIMTEKIARRGVVTPDSYTAQTHQDVNVTIAMQKNPWLVSSENSISDVRKWLRRRVHKENHLIVVRPDGQFLGLVGVVELFAADSKVALTSLLRHKGLESGTGMSIQQATELMAAEDIDVLPVIEDRKVAGAITAGDLIRLHGRRTANLRNRSKRYSLRKRSLRLMVHGKNLIRRS